MRILLVEDDESLAAGLQKALGHEGFVVNHVATGRDALSAVRADPPDMIVLDLGLPDMDGLQVLEQVRQRSDHLPVMVLTARGGLDEKVRGLDRGADDYLAKPFEMTELAARLRVFERRLSTATSSRISVGDVELDTAAHSVSVAGVLLDLPRREYMLLKSLLENAGKVVTRDSLEQRLYGWNDDIASNALEVHIHHLRKKLPENLIQTVRGIGYTVKP